MREKHILFLCSWYPSDKNPFAGDFVQRHAIAASTLNKISVLHAIKDPMQKKNFKIEKTNNKGITEIIVYYSESKFKGFNYIRRLRALLIGLKNVKKFDLVHLNVTYPAGLIALYLKLFHNKKYVITEHWTEFREERFNQINPIERFLIIQILRNSSKLLPVSEDLAKSMKIHSAKIPYEVIPNVVFTDYFKVLEKEGNSLTKFLHLSSLKTNHKNIPGILNVIKRLVDEKHLFEFHLGGTGNTDFIEEFIKEHRLEEFVFTFGMLTYKEVPNKMKEFDAFVLFSNYENQPCVQTESYACGLPFLGTDVGGVKEYFPENFGVLIEKGDEEKLYLGMKSVIEGRKFASKTSMHEYAVENFSPRTIAKRFNQTYIEILNEG